MAQIEVELLVAKLDVFYFFFKKKVLKVWVFDKPGTLSLDVLAFISLPPLCVLSTLAGHHCRLADPTPSICSLASMFSLPPLCVLAISSPRQLGLRHRDWPSRLNLPSSLHLLSAFSPFRPNPPGPPHGEVVTGCTPQWPALQPHLAQRVATAHARTIPPHRKRVQATYLHRVEAHPRTIPTSISTSPPATRLSLSEHLVR